MTHKLSNTDNKEIVPQKHIVNAWAVVFNAERNKSLYGEISRLDYRYMVFPEREEAEKKMHQYQSIEKSMKITPCTITYTV